MFKDVRRFIIILFLVVFTSTSMLTAYAVTNTKDASTELAASSSAVSINRGYSTYNQTAVYRTALKSTMNCYGYALHVYYRGVGIYGQQPGEFARDTKTYSEHSNELADAISNSETGEELLNFLQSKIYADFNGLGYYSNEEWIISSTTATASVPTGYRKIALVVALGEDYHFYMRHNDGTWSHKQGTGAVSNKSLTSGVVITDENASWTLREGKYNDGIRYYLIKKSAVVDYPHGGGHASGTTYTTTYFKDCAGDTISKASSITTSTTARFDYAEDVDYYAYVPSTTATYTFTTSLTLSSYNVQMVIYDTYGNILVSDYNSGNANIACSLTQGVRYFIKVYDANQSVVDYTLQISRN